MAGKDEKGTSRQGVTRMQQRQEMQDERQRKTRRRYKMRDMEGDDVYARLKTRCKFEGGA